MSHDGYLDSTDGGILRGWAVDSTRAGTPVEVTLTLSNGWSGTVLADEYRPDLHALGMGAGRHGFSCRLSSPAQRSPVPRFVSARITGTEFELRRSPLPVGELPPIEIVAGDIVSNCNLRCPFCITDYEAIRGLRQMPLATFRKSLDLLPLVPDGGFWLSCMHEPTLHAEFVDFLDAIPPGLRRKVSFTTNLCKRLDEETLQRIALSGVHSIRVSFDSMDSELFGRLRKGGRLEVFLQNLRRVAELARTAPQPVLLHVISMVFKDNLDEIPELVRLCRDEFGAGIHEVRFMYYAPHLADWGLEHIPTMEQWLALKSALRAQSPKVEFGDPPDDIHRQFLERRGVEGYVHKPAVFGYDATPATYRAADPLKTGFPVPDEDLRVRLRWDGLLMVEQLPEPEFCANVLDLDDPAAYFRALRAAGAPRPG